MTPSRSEGRAESLTGLKEDEGAPMNRAEWIAASAILLNIATLLFGGGAFWQTVQDHDRRLVAIEAAERTRAAEMTQILVRLERIDRNIIALKERMDKEVRH